MLSGIFRRKIPSSRTSEAKGQRSFFSTNCFVAVYGYTQGIHYECSMNQCHEKDSKNKDSNKFNSFSETKIFPNCKLIKAYFVYVVVCKKSTEEIFFILREHELHQKRLREM